MPSPPDVARCRQLLAQHRVPPHICRHSEQVERVAGLLGRAVVEAGVAALDLTVLRAAALLHDIAKMPCIENHRDHALEGARALSGLGLREIAELVGRHVRLGPWDPSGPVTGAELLNYSDKRVQHETIVGLQERFEDLLVRYGRGNAEVERRIREDWGIITRVEEKIFARLPFGPEEVECLVMRDA
ncbi:MAG: HD domain-containing protein [Deferrisomatales bacterium]|nr:HD domain-containing protein [Deferrisomatales bacterium]